jgi:hypothetical protein
MMCNGKIPGEHDLITRPVSHMYGVVYSLLSQQEFQPSKETATVEKRDEVCLWFSPIEVGECQDE